MRQRIRRLEEKCESLQEERIPLQEMLEEIRKGTEFTSLNIDRLDDLKKSIDIEPCKLCTYCWNGQE